MQLEPGDFIKTREPQYEGGRDGYVVEDMGADGVALIFFFDRYNDRVPGECVGPELWERHELDFQTVER